MFFFFFNDTATTEIYTYGHTLSRHDALPIYRAVAEDVVADLGRDACAVGVAERPVLGAEHVGQDGPDLLLQLLLVHLRVVQVRAELLEQLVVHRSEEHTSELQSLMRISYAVFCLKKKTKKIT